MEMPGQSWSLTAASFLGMWTAMMVAMMLPSLAPALAGYRRAQHASSTGGPWRLGGRTALAGVAYFVVWSAVGAAAYPLILAITSLRARSPFAAHALPLAAGLVLLLAGGVQLSGWKARQLERCRDTARCRDAAGPGAAGAWRHGARLAMHCVLCCAGFMTALLVAGMTDLRIMALVAAAITIERLSRAPGVYTRAAGLILLLMGVVATARALL